jgi:hypothetical protein
MVEHTSTPEPTENSDPRTKPRKASARTAARLAWFMWALCLPFAAFNGGVLGFLSASARIYPDLGINGIEATRRILETNPRVGVVVVTMFEDDDSAFAAMRAGARGYVLKGADAEEVLKVLGAVAEGEAHFGPEIARRLMGFFSTPNPAAPSEVFPELPRGRGFGPHRAGAQQRRDRMSALPQPEDRQEPRL